MKREAAGLDENIFFLKKLPIGNMVSLCSVFYELANIEIVSYFLD